MKNMEEQKMPHKKIAWLVGGLLFLAFLLNLNSMIIGKGKDGYYFEEPSLFMPEFSIKVEMFDNEKDISKEYERKTGEYAPRNLVAFAIVSANTFECTIYIIDPQKKYMPEFIGHELVHCLYGEWHNSQ